MASEELMIDEVDCEEPELNGLHVFLVQFTKGTDVYSRYYALLERDLPLAREVMQQITSKPSAQEFFASVDATMKEKNIEWKYVYDEMIEGSCILIDPTKQLVSNASSNDANPVNDVPDHLRIVPVVLFDAKDVIKASPFKKYYLGTSNSTWKIHLYVHDLCGYLQYRTHTSAEDFFTKLENKLKKSLVEFSDVALEIFTF